MRKFLSEQSGRSMIEMLGVLAIIGVLSVGGIAGYSKAMAKYKQTKIADQISMLVTNIRTLYGNSSKYDSISAASAINMGAVDKEMIKTTGTGENTTNEIKNVYGGTVLIAPGTNNESFVVAINGLPAAACTFLASSDWGSNIGSGWVGVGAQSSAYTAASFGGTSTGTVNDGTAPLSITTAASGCAGAASSNAVVLEFK